jgi:8-oxo-dGTP pyrophosphatase MutT (NUDIX family)
VVHKAVACVLRESPGGPELLIFTHPQGTVQIPKGTVDPGESPREAVVRELEEESGLVAVSVVEPAHELARHVPRGPQGVGADEDQTWHLFRLRAVAGTPDTWRHEARGSDEEDGLVFDFAWVALAHAREALHPLYHAVVDVLLEEERAGGRAEVPCRRAGGE